MSRNQREGRYAGKTRGRHLRTRGVNCTVGRIDVFMELGLREWRDVQRVFRTIGGAWRLLSKLTNTGSDNHE